MASPLYTPSVKKHKKHKSEKRDRLESPIDRPPGLKLILKVGNQATPEHTSDFAYNMNSSAYSVQGADDHAADQNDPYYSLSKSHHKKSKKKKKKKDKSKDRDRKHRHHHKEKKRKREEMEMGGGFLIKKKTTVSSIFFYYFR